MKIENANQISLANLFVYNTEFGQKEGKEAEKIFYYYPSSEKIEKQIRNVGFCAGIVKFTETFKPNKPCESVHTEKVRMIFLRVDADFWIVMSLNVPSASTGSGDARVYVNDAVSDQIYSAVLRQIFNSYKLLNGTLKEGLDKYGHIQLKERLKVYFDNFIEKKLNVVDCDIMNTFDGINFMPLDGPTYLKIQCLLNFLEERVPIIEKVVVMHQDQVIWSGLEQQDISLIYKHLREIVQNNANNNQHQTQSPRFLINSKYLTEFNKSKKSPNRNLSINDSIDALSINDSQELERVYLDNNNENNKLEQFYLIPYNYSKLTYFLFIRTEDDVMDLSQDNSNPTTSEAANSSSSSSFRRLEPAMLKSIDEILGKQMVPLLSEIGEPRKKQINTSEKELKYFYFNRLNLAQKSTVSNIKELPRYIINLVAQLVKDLEGEDTFSEIFVKSGKDYWIACKKSDLREVYVIFNQKNANLMSIEEEVKQLWSTDLPNIFFME